MQQIQDILSSYTFWNNTLWDYSVALVIFFGIVILLKIFQSLILARLKKIAAWTSTDIDDALIQMISKISSWFYIVVPAFFASKYLILSDFILKGIEIVFLIALVYEVIRSIEHLIGFGLQKYISTSKKKNEFDPHSTAMVRIAVVMIRMVLWGIALLLILSNLGFDITSLIASLGIGGIAIALALQNILSDIFSSFSLFIDKPFEVGDYIIVGEHSGTVKKIGLKTTRLQALRGEEIVISNKELTTARVQNLKKLEKRRESFIIGVTYETPEKKLEKIPSIIETIINEAEHAEFSRCHLASYSPSSLDYEIVYTLDTSDYNVYMDNKQEIYLKLFKAFKKEKIEFAYPTQTVHMHNS